MRGGRLVLLILLATGLGCRSAKSVPEPGAVLLHVWCAAGVPTPDELRAWVYDDGGSLWDGLRIPETGPLVPASPQDLGTVFIAPGTIRGMLRVRIRGLLAGARVGDGALAIDVSAGGDRSFDLWLEAAVPADQDGDDVPDSLDDCPGTVNPAQGGCPAAEAPDAGREVGRVEVGLPDLADDAPTGAAEVPAQPDAGGDLGPDAAAADHPMDLLADFPEADAGPDTTMVLDLSDDVAAEAHADVGSAVTLDVGTDVHPDARLDADAIVRLDANADLATDDAADASDGAQATCIDGGICNLPQGSSCGEGLECASGFCADGVCCTNDCVGPCRSCNQPNANGVCQGYALGSDPEAECPSGTTCNGVGACGQVAPPNLANGQLCVSDTQCQSGFCTDGVCCESACDAPCEACGTGICLPVKKADDVPECTDTMTCNPQGRCVAG